MNIYVVLYTHKHGTDVSAYSTEDKAWDAVDALKAEYPDEFDEDGPQSWCEVETCGLDYD